MARCRCYTNAQQLVLVLTITNVQSMPAVVSAGCNVLHYAVKEVYGDGKLVLPFPSSSSSRNAPCLSLCFDSAQSALLLWLMFAFINIKTQRLCCVDCYVGWKSCCIIFYLHDLCAFSIFNFIYFMLSNHLLVAPPPQPCSNFYFKMVLLLWCAEVAVHVYGSGNAVYMVVVGGARGE